MSRRPVRLGLIDSGIAATAPQAAAVVAARCFGADGDGDSGGGSGDGLSDPLGHGTEIAALLLELTPSAQLCVAQALGGTTDPRSSAKRIAAALDWLIDCGVELVNLSIGLRRADAGLRRACERAAAAGILLVASAPARGAPVYPAAYAQCLAVSGDARCAANEISCLNSANADFGAHPCLSAGAASSGRGGASYAAARVSARIAALLAAGTRAAAVPDALRALCAHHGPERRRA